MNWDKKVEIELENNVTGWVKLADLLDMTLAKLTKDELEGFVGELSRFVDSSPALFLHE